MAAGSQIFLAGTANYDFDPTTALVKSGKTRINQETTATALGMKELERKAYVLGAHS
jgi:hypothetical protein